MASFEKEARRACETMLQRNVASVGHPAGKRRRSIRLQLEGGGSVIATRRKTEGRAELETRVLEKLRANGAEVPKVLGFDGSILLQEDLGKTRLSMALRKASAAEAEKLLDTALTSLAKTHVAAKTAGLKRHVETLDGEDWRSGLFERPRILGAFLGIPAPDLPIEKLHRRLEVSSPEFVKWDARPPNAIVLKNGDVTWIDWEHCGRRHRLDDLVWLFGDQSCPDFPEAEERLLARHVPAFRDHMAPDDAAEYLGVYGAFHMCVRLGLFLNKHQKTGATDWSSLPSDGNAADSELVARAHMTTIRAARWASWSPLTADLSTWFSQVTAQIEEARQQSASSRRRTKPSALKTSFSDEYKAWIKTQTDKGHGKNGIFKILLDEKFDYDLIKSEMDFEPTIPVDQLVAPNDIPRLDPGRIIVRELKIKNNPYAAKRKRRRKKSAGSTDTKPAISQKGKLLIPNAVRSSANGAELYTLRDFLNEEECQELIRLIMSSLRQSTLTNDDSPDQKFRTSRTCDLKRLKNPFVTEIDRRICGIMGIDPSCSEPIQGQYYEIGQEFKAHTDYFEKKDLEKHTKKRGQRTYTFMKYLNDSCSGGETRFDKLGKTYPPRQGMAIIWNSLDENGKPNRSTMHHGLAVKTGYKAIVTKWFRTGKTGTIFTKDSGEFIPNHTKTGFYKEFLSQDLFTKILDYYGANRPNGAEEQAPGEIQNTEGSCYSGNVLIDLPAQLKTDIHTSLKPVLEAWSGVKLESTDVSGIRVHGRGAIVKPHRDASDDQIISAVVNVDQELDAAWPIEIEDNYYRRHHIILQPGEVLFYEGRRLLHGMPTPLNGSHYADLSCAFKPVDSQSKSAK